MGSRCFGLTRSIESSAHESLTGGADLPCWQSSREDRFSVEWACGRSKTSGWAQSFHKSLIKEHALNHLGLLGMTSPKAQNSPTALCNMVFGPINNKILVLRTLGLGYIP